MLRAVPMSFLRVQVAAKDAAAVTRCIAREGVLHLVDVAHGRLSGLSQPPALLELLARYHDLEHRALRTAERLGLLVPPTSGRLADASGDPEQEREALEARLRPVEREVDEAWAEATRAKDAATRLSEALERTRFLLSSGVDANRFCALRFAHARLARGPEEALARAAALLPPTPFVLAPLSTEKGVVTFAAATTAANRERLDDVLRATGSELLALSDAPKDAAALERDVEAARTTYAAAKEKLAALRARHANLVAELVRRAQVTLLLLQAQSHFAAAGRFVVVSGWVPKHEAAKLARALGVATDGRAVVEILEPEGVAEVSAGYLKVPILHRNPVLLRPFERLIRVYGTPGYHEVEPTAFFAISFLLMFGLMFGDVGHGAVLFSAGFILFRRFPRFLDYGIILMEAAVSSILFGFLYGSVFGLETVLPALWLRPMHDLSRFMPAAIGIGVVLLTFGIAINVINAWRSGQRAQALFGLGGVFGGFLYWIALVLAARALLPRGALPGWILFALAGGAAALLLLRPFIVRRLAPQGVRGEHEKGPVALRLLEGSIELVDVFVSFFTNTLSFVRVAAFAAVHAGVCVAVFALADTLVEVRFGGALSALVIVVGNALVILLEGLIVSVQALRLEYYEFFSRFFRGGGEAYQPFSIGSLAAPEKGGRDVPAPEVPAEGRAGRGGAPAARPSRAVDAGVR